MKPNQNRSMSTDSTGTSSSSNSSFDDDFLDSFLVQNQRPNNKHNLDEYADENGLLKKKLKHDNLGCVVPPEFPAPLPLRMAPPSQETCLGPMASVSNKQQSATVLGGCKQFWKAGGYDERNASDFTHDSAAFAELLDNALDEVPHGATSAHVDVMKNKKDTTSMMLLVRDDGVGMTPDKMRQCMSLGYSYESSGTGL